MVVAGGTGCVGRLGGDGPLGGWSTLDPPLVLTGRDPGPPGGAVLPGLLPTEDGEVHEPVAPQAGLRPAVGRPVRLVHLVVIVAHVAGMEPELPAGDKRDGVAGRVPG